MNYAKAPMVEITDEDGDALRLEDYVGAPVGHITTSPNGMYLDRERAVTLIEALTARVEALDALDAAEAARVAKAAREKFKAGDQVRGVNTRNRYTIVTDEEDGYVGAVYLPSGTFRPRTPVSQFTRP